MTIERIQPVLVVRDKHGFWTHPELSKFLIQENEEIITEEEMTAFCVSQRIETIRIDMYDDIPHDSELYKRHFGNEDQCADEWTPTTPEGNGWFILSIHDTEDGPTCLFARYLKPCAHCGHDVALKLIDPESNFYAFVCPTTSACNGGGFAYLAQKKDIRKAFKHWNTRTSPVDSTDEEKAIDSFAERMKIRMSCKAKEGVYSLESSPEQLAEVFSKNAGPGGCLLDVANTAVLMKHIGGRSHIKLPLDQLMYTGFLVSVDIETEDENTMGSRVYARAELVDGYKSEEPVILCKFQELVVNNTTSFTNPECFQQMGKSNG